MPAYTVGTITKPAFVSTVVNDLAKMLVNEDMNDRQRKIDDAVNTINSLIIPRAYITIEDNNRLHVIIVEPKGTPVMDVFVISKALHYAAHVVWRFDPLNDVWSVLKTRTQQDPSVYPTFKVR